MARLNPRQKLVMDKYRTKAKTVGLSRTALRWRILMGWPEEHLLAENGTKLKELGGKHRSEAIDRTALLRRAFPVRRIQTRNVHLKRESHYENT